MAQHVNARYRLHRIENGPAARVAAVVNDEDGAKAARLQQMNQGNKAVFRLERRNENRDVTEIGQWDVVPGKDIAWIIALVVILPGA